MKLSDGFSIIIVTWNNVDCVRRCVRAIREHTTFPYEIILHINEGSDGTYDYAMADNINFSHTRTNIGICKGTNMAAKLASRPYVCAMNDDQMVLPGWDTEIQAFADKHSLPEKTWISPMCVEGFGGNPVFLSGDKYNYGRTPDTYREADLIENLSSLRDKQIPRNCTHQPFFVLKDTWHAVGGLTEDFDRAGGFGNDPDIIKKVRDYGYSDFVSVPNSLVYHFGSVVTRKTKRPEFHGKSRRIFSEHHGISLDDYVHKIHKVGQPWTPS